MIDYHTRTCGFCKQLFTRLAQKGRPLSYCQECEVNGMAAERIKATATRLKSRRAHLYEFMRREPSHTGYLYFFRAPEGKEAIWYTLLNYPFVAGQKYEIKCAIVKPRADGGVELCVVKVDKIKPF